MPRAIRWICWRNRWSDDRCGSTSSTRAGRPTSVTAGLTFRPSANFAGRPIGVRVLTGTSPLGSAGDTRRPALLRRERGATHGGRQPLVGLGWLGAERVASSPADSVIRCWVDGPPERSAAARKRKPSSALRTAGRGRACRTVLRACFEPKPCRVRALPPWPTARARSAAPPPRGTGPAIPPPPPGRRLRWRGRSRPCAPPPRFAAPKGPSPGTARDR